MFVCGRACSIPEGARREFDETTAECTECIRAGGPGYTRPNFTFTRASLLLFSLV